MTKKIKDLSKEEAIKICGMYQRSGCCGCIDCPLFVDHEYKSSYCMLELLVDYNISKMLEKEVKVKK